MRIHARRSADRALPAGAKLARRSDDRDVVFDLDDLTSLLGRASGLAATTQRMADYAVQAFAQVDGAVVRLLASPSTVGYSGVESTRLVDELHDSLHEGPALDAASTGRLISCDSLGGSHEWRRFGPRAGRLGLHSVLCVPLALSGEVVGVISSYSSRKNAFGDADRALGAHYSSSAAAVLQNAYLLEVSREQIAQLTEALRTRPQIDRAVGILMSRTGKSPEQALDSLRRVSNARRVKVVDIAGGMVDEAVRRARRRQTMPSAHQPT